ncbi:hypothetical protein AHMF7605_10960 [Adhaeribacter arboris]|uniref:HTH cro/C1-type domain-containing protein n=1 Tax=Adhaeribacter arboris TaxID=2072846 RepID=A0A2T2YER9_9BACT|nr:hypothetical protein [Adhaeribacter arboris]PSR54002.1 hypothetical protein AHMF7605_10960 [Adhaeribacter arboris]
MDNGYDRTQLLKTALEHSAITIDELANNLGLTPILLYHNLESEEHGAATVKAVAAALRVPMSYFEGAFYYDERGQLVPSQPK